eukprot:6135235-Amphidinium_carterae.1
MASNMKLYKRNQQQKNEAIWIGRDTTTGHHITLTPEFGKLRSRTGMRLRKEQQIDKDLLLREWYADDDNEDYDKYELKAAIKEGIDAIQKTEACTRVQNSAYTAQQLKHVIQTKWVARSRPGGNRNDSKRDSWLKATQKVNLDKIYAATPAAITLRILLTFAQLLHHNVYMSDIQSAFLNAPVQPGTIILLNKQLYGLRDVPQKFQQHLSTILKQLGLRQLRSDQCVYYTNDITVMFYVHDLLLIGEEDKVKELFNRPERQKLLLKHVTKLQRDH